RMDQKTFVDRLTSVVLDGLSRDLAENWHHPPGRLRSEDRTRRIAQLNAMSAPDRELFEEFGQAAARSAVFGMLAVLDGSRAIEDATEGHLELHHVRNGKAELLASSASD